MSGRVFFDTNVLVYAYSSDDLVKRQAALALGSIPDRWLSTQVLIELVNVFSRKLKISWPDVQIALIEVIDDHAIHTSTPATVAHATRLAKSVLCLSRGLNLGLAATGRNKMDKSVGPVEPVLHEHPLPVLRPLWTFPLGLQSLY